MLVFTNPFDIENSISYRIFSYPIKSIVATYEFIFRVIVRTKETCVKIYQRRKNIMWAGLWSRNFYENNKDISFILFSIFY